MPLTNRRLRLACFILAGLAGLVVPRADARPASGRRAVPPSDPAETHLSGPYVHANLAVYLIHGAEARPGRVLVPLARAMAEKKVVVYETGRVNQLVIENTSDDEVFVQAGDIVKGGKQDRVLGDDLVLPPRSGKLPIAAHCVEQGRWRPRGAEPAERFASSELGLADKQAKLANHGRSQAGVWANVEQVQRKLQGRLREDVRAAESASSLQLTLEHERVRQAVAAYRRALGSLAADHADAVGFAFALDGRLNAAEVYGSRALFRELWPKLLHAAAVEAVAESAPASARPLPGLDGVRAFLERARAGAPREHFDGPLAQGVAHETRESLLVETRDKSSRALVHRSYVAK